MDGSKILREQSDDHTIDYLYSSNGLFGFKYSEEMYLYEKNILGDIVRIYNNCGEIVGEYAYDAFGNVTIITDINGVASINPFRYRGYYFDSDTGLYYLNYRYFDPRLGRFISPDDASYINPNNVNGLNIYSYCNNDPINLVDPTGHFGILAALIIGCVVGLVAGAGYAVYEDYSDDQQVNGSIGVGAYIGYTLLGGAIGAAVGAGIAYIAPHVAAFAGTSFTIGGGVTVTSGGALAVSSGITITGAQILKGVGVLAGAGIMYMISMHGEPNTKVSEGGSFGEYDENGNLSYRVDTTGKPHYIKSIKKYCLPHIHKFTWKLVDGVWRFVKEVLPYIL